MDDVLASSSLETMANGQDAGADVTLAQVMEADVEQVPTGGKGDVTADDLAGTAPVGNKTRDIQFLHQNDKNQRILHEI